MNVNYKNTKNITHIKKHNTPIHTDTKKNYMQTRNNNMKKGKLSEIEMKINDRI